MNRLIIAATVAISFATAGTALAGKPKCNIVGTYTTNIDGTAGPNLVMKSNKKGSAGQNAECNDENATITTTLLNATTWNANITSKKCSVELTSSVTFNGSCVTVSGETATGTITIPNVGALPLTITKE